MSRNGLIPTPTVDKNGKSTTVYRKTASSATGKKLPVPTLKATKQAVEKPNTPLPVSEPVARDKVNDYRKRLRGTMHLSFSMEPNASELGVIRDIIANGHVSASKINAITSRMGFFAAGERISHYNRNALLIMERVARDKGDDFIEEQTFMDAVEGLSLRRRSADIHVVPEITTEEELDSLSAVVKMTLFAKSIEDPYATKSHISERKEYFTASNVRLNGAAFKNHAFTALVREKYEDYDRIEQYVIDRGFPTNKSGVEALRDYLDAGEENHTAMADGWL